MEGRQASDPFERHGITHLSPSSLRLWRDEPAVWIGKYMLRAPDESGPGAMRGKAVEAGVDQLLYGQGIDRAIDTMYDAWASQVLGEVSDDITREYEALGGFLAQAQLAFADKPMPLQRQARVELHLPGINVPVIGFADWVWRDHGTDLKTTWRMPNNGAPDPAHVEQVTVYSVHFGVPFDLTYCTPKKWTRFDVTRQMQVEAYDRVIETANAIRSMLAHVDSAHDALSMFSPDYTSFYWRPPMIEAVRAAKAARVLPGEHNHQPLQIVE